MFISKIRAGESDDRSPWGDFWFEPVSVRTGAGMRVSADTAMRLTAVFACVQLLSKMHACMPFCLYRPKPDGKGKDVVTDHWLAHLIGRRPNRFQNPFEWRQMVQGHLVWRGNAYNRIVPGPRGTIAELVPLHPDRMRVEVLEENTPRYRYRYTQRDGSDEILPSGSVWHLRGLSSNGFVGLNPIEVAREALGAALAAQDFGARFFKNDAKPGGWIEYPGGFKDKQAKDTFRESWQAAQTGASRGKTAVLENGMKYHELGVTNKDAQFLESRQFGVIEIARLFGVPPHLIAELSRATFSNIEQQSLEFVKFSMTPWAELWESSIETELLPDDEGLEVEFDMDNLERGDSKARAEYYSKGILDGWLTRNEARHKENLNPLEELDEPLQPLNMVPAGEEPAPAPGGGAPADEPAPTDDEAEAHADRLLHAVCGRVVRKEIAAVRKFVGLADQVRDFYAKHGRYVRESLACSEACAHAWCAGRLAELLDEQQSLPARDVNVILETWEHTAAAELAARVRLDVSTKTKGA
jgi:HK97 family phage portal protein